MAIPVVGEVTLDSQNVVNVVGWRLTGRDIIRELIVCFVEYRLELIPGRGREVIPCGAQSRNQRIALREGD